MRRLSPLLLAVLARVLVPCGLLAGVAVAEAQPSAVVGAAGAYVGAPGYGGRWVGGPYRPGVRPGWGAWGGWGYGYPRYGWGYGYGWGLGLGYGAGWALATVPAWGYGWPAPTYVAPSWVPTVTAPVVEQVVVEERKSAAPEAAARQPGYWYYCTEPAGYYPYVNTCSRPWIAVNPTAR
jgi:hypothetical protein